MIGLKLFGSTVKWVMVTVALDGSSGTVTTTYQPNEQMCLSQIEQTIDPNVAHACMLEKDYLDAVRRGQSLPVFKSNRAIAEENRQAKAEDDAAERIYQERQRLYEQQNAEFLSQQKLIEEQKAQEAAPKN